jgi:hypothetical protein
MLTLHDRQILKARIQAHDAIERYKARFPCEFYKPHAGQEAFHRAPHIIRALWPGNGFGKTRAMGTELNWWATHSHPYQITPKWPIIGIWSCETFKQFEILRDQLQTECFGPERSASHPEGWKFNKNDKAYIWPDGGRLFLISGDGSWTHVQGINPDWVGFDEEPPRALWNEMKMRRRGRRKTRYCFAATATQGLTWMYHELYLEWVKFHSDRGVHEGDAHERQLHPRVWAYAKGGINDNPGADAGDRDWYASQTFTSDAERQVRLFGGFADFSGTPVFDAESLERMKPFLIDGEQGTLRLKEGINPDVVGRIYEWVPEGQTEAGRVTIFEHPRLSETRYVIGFDSAYGLRDGDFDYAVVLDRNTGMQVAEAQGHWGDSQWAEIVRALYWYYGVPLKHGAFICGERQVGLMTLRRLMDEMGVGFMFYDRDEAKRSRRRSDVVGHHRRAGDLVIPRLRRAIGPRDLHGRLAPSDVTIRSRELHRQCCKYQFRPRLASVAIDEAHDSQLEYGAPKGDHDDGVMALAYALMAAREVEKFEQAEAEYEEGTFGHQFRQQLVKVAPGYKPPTPTAAADPFARE